MTTDQSDRDAYAADARALRIRLHTDDKDQVVGMTQYLQAMSDCRLGDWFEGVGLVDSAAMRKIAEQVATQALNILSPYRSARVEVLEKALGEITDQTQRVRGKSKTQAYDDGISCDGVNHFLDLQAIDEIARLALSGEGTQPQCHTSSSAESCCSSSLERSSAKCAEPIIKESDASPSSTGEQVKELRDRVAHMLYEIGEDRHALTVESAAATIERLEAQLRYIDQRCEEQIQDRIRLGEALTLATRERDEARKVIERAANFIASEYAADNDAGVLIPDVEPRLIHESLCDFLSKQEGK